ncbi:low temperature requirement protein A [Methylocapsa acidiphila]|uniref:low temperature requirement protein A n=1 Tax=Methylocapsa acidiphila TaxID=133552 RepID=UPI0004235B26|nr:low temperature requirement protein A [Methylocapsa acidiphila]
MTAIKGSELLRSRRAERGAPVANIELFFDLVFVFAVTQLSHALLKDPSVLGAIRVLLLFLAVWWVWVFTCWVTNWLDPERGPVRLLLLAMMLAGLIMSTSIPEAFEAKGLPFAFAYVLMQVGRSVFVIWALGDASPTNTRNFQRIASWLGFAGLFWIAGAFSEGAHRLELWTIGLALEYVSPSLGFYVPGLGRSTARDWDIEGGHLAERCSLFIIIALGESLLVTGAAFAEIAWSLPSVCAFVVAFVGSVAAWWIYFDTGAETGHDAIAGAPDPGRLGRLVYTYIHLLIVAGIIVSAVGDELILAHPQGAAGTEALAILLGAPALYLIGNIFFKWAVRGRPPLSHLAGVSALGLLLPFAPRLALLPLGAATAAILVSVAAWERISLGGRRGPAQAAGDDIRIEN